MRRIDRLRAVLAAAFGVVAVGSGIVVSVVGFGIVVFGLFIFAGSAGLHGAGQNQRWLAVFIVPLGGFVTVIGYGAVRLGMESMMARRKESSL
jgi:membrane-associated protease RseP (regulator of RpoE activity)